MLAPQAPPGTRDDCNPTLAQAAHGMLLPVAAFASTISLFRAAIPRKMPGWRLCGRSRSRFGRSNFHATIGRAESEWWRLTRVRRSLATCYKVAPPAKQLSLAVRQLPRDRHVRRVLEARLVDRILNLADGILHRRAIMQRKCDGRARLTCHHRIYDTVHGQDIFIDPRPRQLAIWRIGS